MRGTQVSLFVFVIRVPPSTSTRNEHEFREAIERRQFIRLLGRLLADEAFFTSLLIHVHAAVHRDSLAGHEVAVVGGEKDHRADEILGGAQAGDRSCLRGLPGIG